MSYLIAEMYFVEETLQGKVERSFRTKQLRVVWHSEVKLKLKLGKNV